MSKIWCNSLVASDNYTAMHGAFVTRPFRLKWAHIQKVVFNRHILPIDIASLFETQFERPYKGRRCAGYCA
jgi:hypothetical protein